MHSTNAQPKNSESVATPTQTPVDIPVQDTDTPKTSARKSAAKKAMAKSAAKRSIKTAAPVLEAEEPRLVTKNAPKANAKATATTEKVATETSVEFAKPAKESKTKKAATKKPKLVRDSFTFPEDDYALIAVLKQRALNAGRDIKKSELLRAGLAALAAMSENDLLVAMDGVERIKTGRPSK